MWPPRMASLQAHESFPPGGHPPDLNGHKDAQNGRNESPRGRVLGPCFASYEPGPHSPGFADMGSSRRFLTNQGQPGRPQHSVKQSLCDAVVKQVLQRVRSYGYSEAVCEQLQGHFERLPSRYSLNIDPLRHEDVLLHMQLIDQALRSELEARNSLSTSPPPPQVHVRKVRLVIPYTPGQQSEQNSRTGSPTAMSMSEDSGDERGGTSEDSAGDERMHEPSRSGRDSADSRSGGGRSVPIPMRRPPLPTFGSNNSLSSMIGTSPGGNGRTPPVAAGVRVRSSPVPRPTFGSFTSLVEMEDELEDARIGARRKEATYGHEITVATGDRQGLLKYMTSALSDFQLELNIREAHVFSTSDGMALEVFVVEGWTGDSSEELRQAVLSALGNKLLHGTPRSKKPQREPMDIIDLKAATDAIAYEDWAVDYNLLDIGERLGGGSSGRLYRGRYRGSDVAVKVILLEDLGVEASGTLRAAPAGELIQMFKQEVSIMRIVRHKNLVQFIGACSNWPRLCIVTELMAGGSVRDMMQSRGTGLEPNSAIRVLRDTARGMDFLHKRGIVHRDLKAANLLIDEHDVVKVCDFGVARMTPAALQFVKRPLDNDSTEMTAETGTYRWMAPEVLEHRAYDHRADVYSFGIVIWELLTGDIPYAGLTPLQAAIGVVQRQLRPTLPPVCPPRLFSLAERCWHPNPQMRPEFSEILMILEDCIKPIRKSFFGSSKKKPVA
ncbi:ATMRK serine/threonine protein kinase-like [Klebsormidium nitens]|uniref:ATMRK serine/threonine protein kinase-like n=1 Tax=Klebsormidium nitens TaxID=105231 RepID=A0A1Y1ICB9_KLENI|nr:ATMRK serine/threonine protein kinase-like [Klebsormidium nitens]|eukprot:GAQ86356.1 ATMRK serine/threonine protein kinase-like [Klebsormidium nitens]